MTSTLPRTLSGLTTTGPWVLDHHNILSPDYYITIFTVLSLLTFDVSNPLVSAKNGIPTYRWTGFVIRCTVFFSVIHSHLTLRTHSSVVNSSHDDILLVPWYVTRPTPPPSYTIGLESSSPFYSEGLPSLRLDSGLPTSPQSIHFLRPQTTSSRGPSPLSFTFSGLLFLIFYVL